MKRHQRHLLVLLCAVGYLMVLVMFEKLGDFKLDGGTAFKDAVYESTAEAWNYQSGTSWNSREADDYQNQKCPTGKGVPLVVNWTTLHEPRMLADSDYCTPLHLKCFSGPERRAAAERVQAHLSADLLVRKAAVAEPEGREGLGGATAARGVIGSSRQRLEGAVVERVGPLPEGVPRTPAGGQTRLDRAELMALDARLRTQIRKGKIAFFDIPRSRAVRPPRHPWRTFYIALNLINNEHVLPFLTEALVAFLEDEIAPFFDLRTSVVVVIYASLSKDATAPLIRSVLIPALQKAGVEAIFATVSGVCLGYHNRQGVHERIEWLQCVRNKLLEPLQELGMGIFPHADTNASVARGEPELGGFQLDEVLGAGALPDPDSLVVIFLNDILFRPSDLALLLETVPEPKMAAEVDPEGEPIAQENDQKEPPREAVNRGAAVEAPSGFDMACAMDFYHIFYDIWVTRDYRGLFFDGKPPYAQHIDTVRSLHRIFANRWTDRARAKGGDRRSEGVLVKSCWNGVAAVRGRLFLPLQAGLVSQVEGEADRDYLATLLNPLTKYAPEGQNRGCAVGEDLVFFLSKRLLEESGVGGEVSGRAAARGHGDREGEGEGEGEGLAKQWEQRLRDYVGRLAEASGDVVIERLEITVCWACKEGVAVRLPYMTPALAKSRLLKAFRVPSGFIFDFAGALYDDHGGVDGQTLPISSDEEKRQAVFIKGIEWHYEQLLARRLDDINERRKRVFTQNGTLLTPFPKLMCSLEELREDLQARNPDIFRRIPLLPWPAAMEGVNSSVELAGGKVGTPVTSVANDIVFYRTRVPALRFRHSLAPSLGAVLDNRAIHGVRDAVCLSSECLLLSLDLAYAVILYERRTPVILLNPIVQVAYEKNYFGYLRDSDMSYFIQSFEPLLHPFVLAWCWEKIHRQFCNHIQGGGWWTTVTGLQSLCRVTLQDPEPPGKRVSAQDDFLRNAEPTDPFRRPFPVLVGHSLWGGGKRWVNLDLMRFTTLYCDYYTQRLISLIMCHFYLLCQFLLIVLLVCFVCVELKVDLRERYRVFLEELDDAAAGGMPQHWREAVRFIIRAHQNTASFTLASQPRVVEKKEGKTTFDSQELSCNPNTVKSDLLLSGFFAKLTPEEQFAVWIYVQLLCLCRSLVLLLQCVSRICSILFRRISRVVKIVRVPILRT